MDEALDILPLLGTVIYPLTVTPLAVAQPAAVRLLSADDGAPRRLVVVTLREPAQPLGPVGLADCAAVGTLALIHRLLRLPDGSLRVAVEGLQRVELLEQLADEPHLRARVRLLPEPPTNASDDLVALAELRHAARSLAGRPPGFSQDLLTEIEGEEEPRRLIYLLAGPLLARASLAERQRLLELESISERIDLLHMASARLPLASPPDDQPSQSPAANGVSGRTPWLRAGPEGGELVWIEALQMPGAGALVVTGQRGAPAQDAALMAQSYLRARAADLGLDAEWPRAIDLHAHIPAGVSREEQAGCGAPLALALLSLLLNRPPRDDAVMLGELSLHGRLLPVGRLREKLVAARQAGISTIVIPAGQAAELRALPAALSADLQIVPAERFDEALDALLLS